MELLGPNGQPMSQYVAGKKAKPAKMGTAFGDWHGRDLSYAAMPGGEVLTFNLDALTLTDYRQMRTHPQVNASLSVLSFMIHQCDWKIVHPNRKIETMLNEMMTNIWSRLNRALSQSHWAGYSPCAIEYDNDLEDKYVVVDKIKDLYPEDCAVHWKEEKGHKPVNGIAPKFKIFDGIKQWGAPEPIPAFHSLWYPFMIENGNMHGRKLLKSAFTPWYFSIIMHLFANRYYERFGEPTPIGRAPFDSDIDLGGEIGTVSGAKAMEMIMEGLRNRAVVTLPSDRDPVTKEFDYTLDYLEADMRGIDFERYLKRLDEEISLAIFTPVLLFRTGDVGSNNLGVQHTQTFLWQVNAIVADMQDYIERYILSRVIDLNFGTKAPRAKFTWRKLGKENIETTRAVIVELLRNGSAKVDLVELGQALGMTLEEVKEVAPDPSSTGDNNPQPDNRVGRDKPADKPRGVGEPRATGRQIAARVASQVERAWRQEDIRDLNVDFGYAKRMRSVLVAEGVEPSEAGRRTDVMMSNLDAIVKDLASIGKEQFNDHDEFMSLFERHMEREIDDALR